jgi:L-fucose isomerase-like protein
MTQTSKSLTPRIGVASLSSPLEIGADRAPAAAENLARALESIGCDVVQLGSLDEPDKSVAAGRKLAESHVHAVAFAAVTWYEDYLALDLLEECSVPVLLWSLPGMQTGALCGSQQLTAYLKQLGVPYRCVFGELDSAEGLERAKAFLLASALKEKMRRARIGLAGHRVVGMTEVSANEMALKKAIGPRVVTLDMPLLLARADEMPNDQARRTWQQLTSRSAACEVSEEEGLDSMRVYAAIKELVDRHRLDALAIGCYPHLMGRVCLAASLLADEGIPLGCEGDVNGAVGQLMLTLLTGEPTHNTDWLEPMDDGSVVFAHCGSGSFSLAEKQDDIKLASVRLMGQGVCALFPAKPGPVTLLSLLPLGDGYQCAMLEGEAISTEMVFPGNPLRVRFPQPTSQLIDWIHAEGVGHHWMAGYGHVGDEIRQWASIAGGSLRLVRP